MPKADTAVRLARALGSSVEWLVRGVEGGSVGTLSDASDSEWVMLPRLDLNAFSLIDGRPDAVEEIPVRRDWLYRVARQSKDLWLAEMPGDAMPEIAAAGEFILCRDPQPPLADGRAYVWLANGRPIVRRVSLTPTGLILKAGDPNIDPLVIPADDIEDALEGLTPIALVLGSIALRPA